jgi:hypothetical protein
VIKLAFPLKVINCVPTCNVFFSNSRLKVTLPPILRVRKVDNKTLLFSSGDVERCRRRPSSPIYSKKLNPLPLLHEGESIGSPSDAQIFSLDNSFFSSYVQAGCQPTRMPPSPSCPTTGNREASRPSKQGCGSGSQLDPDSIGSVDPYRIRNLNPDPGGQK